jgi:hypothetical protein
LKILIFYQEIFGTYTTLWLDTLKGTAMTVYKTLEKHLEHLLTQSGKPLYRNRQAITGSLNTVNKSLVWTQIGSKSPS